MMNRIKIFDTIGKAEELLPLNKPKMVIVSGSKYCFVRTADGIRAFSDLCPHQRASLSQGTVTAFGEIVCPLHQYRYDLSLGEESTKRCSGIRFLKITVDHEGVFLTL